ncbi:DUF3137 domain-containing protein [Alkalicaulis satelles]|uniref:DUF3137 domain-containing protein n=1 Tax=Alkalicaulis satelles TaxID=2609175 RepID=A0A5M6ZI97_9PROT|nr:DUF3137 domain-containing protein [Alkalicaulis satelles]KAA5804543.1 DUF3137 domain-containing protein [Alkalicaulis satelles]
MKDLDSAMAELGPWLSEKEARRKAAVSRFMKGTAGALGAALVLGAILGLSGLPAPVAGIASVAAALLIMAWAGHPMTQLHKDVKLGLNTRMAEAFGLSYAPKPASPARFDAFRSHGLIPHSDKRAFEDHFSGEAHGADFELYEAHLQQRRRSRKRTYYVTVFRGVLIRITFPRTVEGVTLVTRDKGLFNGLEAFSRRHFSGRSLERIGLVDLRFSRLFEVYGTDQVMARYLLTPSFMERLLRLEEILKGKNVRCVFDEDLVPESGRGELLIAAQTGNKFEPGSMFAPLDDRSRIARLYAEFELIEDIMHTVLQPPAEGGGVGASVVADPEST